MGRGGHGAAVSPVRASRGAPSGKVPAVFAVDVAAGAVLLEAIEPGTCADELPRPPSAQEWGELVKVLHCAAPPPGYPRDLRGRCDESFARIGPRQAEPQISRHVLAADIDLGARLYRRRQPSRSPSPSPSRP
jgi:hypothetical protein